MLQVAVPGSSSHICGRAGESLASFSHKELSASLFPADTASHHLQKKCPSGKCSLMYKLYSETDDVHVWQQNLHFLLTVGFLNDVLEIRNCDLPTVCFCKKACCQASFMICQSKCHLTFSVVT